MDIPGVCNFIALVLVPYVPGMCTIYMDYSCTNYVVYPLVHGNLCNVLRKSLENDVNMTLIVYLLYVYNHQLGTFPHTAVTMEYSTRVGGNDANASKAKLYVGLPTSH